MATLLKPIYKNWQNCQIFIHNNFQFSVNYLFRISIFEIPGNTAPYESSERTLRYFPLRQDVGLVSLLWSKTFPFYRCLFDNSFIGGLCTFWSKNLADFEKIRQIKVEVRNDFLCHNIVIFPWKLKI